MNQQDLHEAHHLPALRLQLFHVELRDKLKFTRIVIYQHTATI